MLMARGSGVAVAQAAAAGKLLQPGVKQASEETALETLVEIPDLPQFCFDPAGFNSLLKITQGRSRRIVLRQSLEGRFSGQHSTLDGEMNPLEALRVEEAGRVAENHPSVARNWGNCPPAAVRQRLRPVANHLAAFKQL